MRKVVDEMNILLKLLYVALNRPDKVQFKTTSEARKIAYLEISIGIILFALGFAVTMMIGFFFGLLVAQWTFFLNLFTGGIGLYLILDGDAILEHCMFHEAGIDPVMVPPP